MVIHTLVIVTKIFVEHEFVFKVMNLPSQTLMLWNGLTFTHCVVRIVRLTLTSLLGDLTNTMGRGNRGLDHSILHCCACAYPCGAPIRKTAPKPYQGSS
jgi:hypothetical protein